VIQSPSAATSTCRPNRDQESRLVETLSSLAGLFATPLLLAAATALLAALAGCATALSSFEPAHVPQPGHFQAEAGLDLSVSAGGIQQIVDAARQVDKTAGERSLSDTEKRTIMEGGAQLGLNPPAMIPHVGLVYSPWRGSAVGARLSASGWRVGVRAQLFEQGQSGVDLTVGFGFGRAAFDPPIASVLSTIRVNNFSRWNLDVPITLGRHSSWYRWWGGPRLAYSIMSQSMSLTLQHDDAVIGTVLGSGFYLGASVGAALGFRSVFVGPEMTVAWLFGRADVTALGFTENVTIDALIIYPAFAVMGEF
jgi:hypothetical protein